MIASRVALFRQALIVDTGHAYGTSRSMLAIPSAITVHWSPTPLPGQDLSEEVSILPLMESQYTEYGP